MSKYKLIKEYPGSPNLGTIVTNYRDNIYVENIPVGQGIKDVHKYPEFWEKVVEKDYEILSFRRDDFRNIFYRAANNKFSTYVKGVEGYFTEESMLTHLTSDLDKMHIYSVKRLSDGQIFTINDNLENGCINKFFLADNNITFTTILDSTKRGLYWAKKTPLFKTRDSINIYEGDIYYYINSSFKIVELTGIPYSSHQFNYNYSKNNALVFSTKKAAEEYILMNKSCLSINDIMKKFKKDIKINVADLEDSLVVLVKSKL